MKPYFTFSSDEKTKLYDVLDSIKSHPYQDYPAFNRSISRLVTENEIPEFFINVCNGIFKERRESVAAAHVLRNCPMDRALPKLDQEDPFKDKLAKKKTFIGEAFLALFATISKTPLLAYGNRFEGSFFADVITVNRFSGHDSQFGDTELAYHNDRTAHAVRPDYVTLLGTCCPQDELIFTGFIDGRDIIKHITKEQEEILRQPYFYTPSDIHSSTTGAKHLDTAVHPIVEGNYNIRYRDAWTTYAKSAPEKAKEALIAFMCAMVRTHKSYHRIQEGDLFVFANQTGLHNRTHMEIINPGLARTRWLLKTYSFQDQQTAEQYKHLFKTEVFACVDD